MAAAVPLDPNWPSDLRIVPSTSRVIQLGEGEGENADDAAQDIEGYGIAGRTWEAAYAMRLFLTPPTPLSTVEFSPPCPLFNPTTISKPRRQTLLEIGSGTGYLSLALAPHLPPSTTLIMTDLASVCPLLSSNLREARTRWMNSIHPSSIPTIKVEPLPWGDEDALKNLSVNRDVRDDERDSLTILAADLVYFPFLYPPLLRTLIGLTTPSRPGAPSPTVLFAGKIRSLAREEPFWSAFGRWFEMETVLSRPASPKSDDGRTASWSRFGGAEDIHIFICTRRESTYEQKVPTLDDHLMHGAPGEASSASDHFELLLLSGLADSDSEPEEQ